jgi:hypothetical protein
MFHSDDNPANDTLKKEARAFDPLGWLEGLGFEFLFHFCYSLL